MRIVVLGPSRNPVAQPYAGGQERFTADLVRGLRGRGHYIELYARAGSDPDLADRLHEMPELPPLSQVASEDPGMPEPDFLHDQFVYLAAVADVLGRCDVDAVLNESLHQLPLAMSPLLKAPVVTTLHTPPFPWMEIGAWLAGRTGHFVAVSEALRTQWTTLTKSYVIPNGVDPGAFPVGCGGEDLAWVGRLTPEKGADIAVRAAALTGRHLRLAGPVSDPEWFETVLSPMFGSGAHHVGALSGRDLADLYGSSAATLVTPRWEEPFCLVAAESQMCGTPVVGIRRGGLPEAVSVPGGRLVDPGPQVVARLAAAVGTVAPTNRQSIGAHARAHLSWKQMLDSYEQLLVSLTGGMTDPNAKIRN